MSKSNINIFFSYAKTDSDSDFVYFLVNYIEKKFSNINCIIDEKISVGGDYNTYMDLVKSCDYVFLFLSKDYKNRYISDSNSLSTEFKIIYNRYINDRSTIMKDLNKYPDGTDVILPNVSFLIPILIDNDYKSSSIESISNIKYIDLFSYKNQKIYKKEVFITDHLERDFYNVIKDLIAQLYVRNMSRNKKFNEVRENIFWKLFVRKKHDPSTINEYGKIIVKTFAYEKIRRQLSYFLIGRKGSGKSTVTEQIKNMVDIYKEGANLNVDKFALDKIYTHYQGINIESDANNYINKLTFFKISWELFIYIICMEVVVRENIKRPLEKMQVMQVPKIERYLSSILNYDIRIRRLDKASIYIFCMSAIKKYFDKVVLNSRSQQEYFYSDITASVNFNNVADDTFGVEIVNAFNTIIGLCKKKFLISMDGFDTNFEEFRRNTIGYSKSDPENYNKRICFEIDWLRSFMHLVSDIKSSNNIQDIYSNMDFCITIPKERFLEVMNIERDSYNYFGQYVNLNWSGVELCILLRKRLEYISSVVTNKQQSFDVRLDYLLDNHFQSIPKYIATSVGGRDYKFHIFLYVLRHTFWRPRDIIFYFGNIMASIDNLSLKKSTIDEEVVRHVVSSTTYQIINTEFINEFQNSLINIKDIINSFYGSCQFITMDDLVNKIGKIGFRFCDRVDLVTDIEEKIKFLYEVGFIGIRREDRNRKDRKVIHEFNFNTNDSGHDIRSLAKFKNVIFVLHPIFCEFLNLDTSNNQEIVMDYDFEFLKKNEAFNFVNP